MYDKSSKGRTEYTYQRNSTDGVQYGVFGKNKNTNTGYGRNYRQDYRCLVGRKGFFTRTVFGQKTIGDKYAIINPKAKNKATDDNVEKWIDVNKKFSASWPNIAVKKEPPADADKFREEKNKFERFFSEKPGQ